MSITGSRRRFRASRAFLLGDAAHIHSPAGGQGMNTGIGDAINLAWKLKAALDGAPDVLLDTYETERIAFARRLVKTTDQAFTVATADGEFANLIRVWLAPVVLQAALSFEAAREFAFRTVSQINVNYRASPLSQGRAGHVHAGDRMPWVAVDGSRQLRRADEDGLAGAGLWRSASRPRRLVRGSEVAPADLRVGVALRARWTGSRTRSIFCGRTLTSDWPMRAAQPKRCVAICAKADLELRPMSPHGPQCPRRRLSSMQPRPIDPSAMPTRKSPARPGMREPAGRKPGSRSGAG